MTNTVVFNKGTGLEMLSRQACLILAANINAALTDQETIWAADDIAFAAIIPSVLVPVVLERFSAANIVPGHRPSLIDAPLSRYPNISCMAYASRPGIEQMDQVDSLACTLQIEAMVKAGPYAVDDTSGIGEGLCDSRIQRTTDAIHSVFQGNKTLNGHVQEFTIPPEVDISPVFVKPDQDDPNGTRWFWQGVHMAYTIYRNARAY